MWTPSKKLLLMTGSSIQVILEEQVCITHGWDHEVDADDDVSNWAPQRYTYLANSGSGVRSGVRACRVPLLTTDTVEEHFSYIYR